MENVASTLNDGLQDIVNQIKTSLRNNDRVATGKTIEKITIEVEESSGKIIGRVYAPRYITALEEGRKPSERRDDSNDWRDSLMEWIRARGIDENLFYPIYKSINAKGWNNDRSNRNTPFGGTQGILSDPIKAGVAELKKKIQIQIVQGYKI